VNMTTDVFLVPGADPKSVLCAFYKVGQCMKGDKCKFSHDMSIGRKAEKRSMYEDQRDTENGKLSYRYYYFPTSASLLYRVSLTS